jgi:polysaccharide pyruvyl transferase WcaK-like protein
VITAQVADPACSFSRFFPLRTADQKNCIGLGVVRERLFEDNDVAFSKEEMLKLWSELYMNLLNKGYDCKLFCNGALSDFRFLEKLREYIADRYHITPDYVPRPETVEELTGILCSCKGVIVARLHASILSYAYDIPCVSLVWNHKQTMFGEQTGHEQFFITSKDFHADLIIERLIDAMAQKPDPVSKQKYCSTTQKYIENFLAEYCR